MSCPAITAVPRVGWRLVERIRSVVVLPAPFGPRMPKISPARQLNDTPSTAFTPPPLPLNVLARSRTSMRGAVRSTSP
jgi:hypothetical protein